MAWLSGLACMCCLHCTCMQLYVHNCMLRAAMNAECHFLTCEESVLLSTPYNLGRILLLISYFKIRLSPFSWNRWGQKINHMWEGSGIRNRISCLPSWCVDHQTTGTPHETKDLKNGKRCISMQIYYIVLLFAFF